MEIRIPMKKATSRLKKRHERKVRRKTSASSRVARKMSRISFQSIRVWTEAIRSAASAASGIWRTRGQQNEITTAVIPLLQIEAKRVLAWSRELRAVRVGLPELGIAPTKVESNTL